MDPTMLQVDAEIDGFAEVLRREKVRSFLEIGSKFGGSLMRCAKALQPRSRIVSVDLPNGTKAWKESSVALDGAMRSLARDGHEAHLIWGNSQDRKIIDMVKSFGPYDAIFIDGDHRLPGVTADWINYGPMGRIVAFHDIAWRRAPEWVGTRIDVPQFWDKLKANHRHVEFRHCPTGKNNGIGVLWH